MINFLLLMLIPMGIAIGSLLYFRKHVTLWEFGVQCAVPAVLVVIGLAVAYHQATTDVELLNGRVVTKDSQRVSCSHSYRCRCRTVRTGKNSSTTVCDTCYEHSYDVSWYVRSNISLYPTVEIDRVNRQGTQMPPRWAAAFVGEPFTVEHSYTNYILANPDSVLLGGKGDVERFKPMIPPYPRSYDYYRAPHVLNIGVPLTDGNAWEWLADEINADLGPSKQVNVLFLLVKTDDPKYTLALKDVWIGGKKNDVVIVIGSLDGKQMAFVDVVTWSPRSLFKVKLKDALFAIGNLDKRDDIANTVRRVVRDDYERMHMKDFEYLARSFQPSGGAMIFLFVLGCLSSIGLAVWTIRNEHTNYVPSYRRSYR